MIYATNCLLQAEYDDYVCIMLTMQKETRIYQFWKVNIM